MASKNAAINDAIYLAAVVLIVAALVVVFPTNVSDKDMTIEQQIIKELAQREEIKPYVNYPATVKFLSASELDRLKSEQPAIYGDVQTGQFEIDYDGTKVGSDAGLLVIYDFNTKKIIKMFAVQNLVF